MWQRSFSTVEPLLAEKVSNNRYIIRRNVTKVILNEGTDNEYEGYEYEERIVSEIEYNLLIAIDNIELRHDSEVEDNFMMKLIEEGVL